MSKKVRRNQYGPNFRFPDRITIRLEPSTAKRWRKLKNGVRRKAAAYLRRALEAYLDDAAMGNTNDLEVLK